MVISKITPVLGFLSDLEVLPPATAGGLQVFGLRGHPRRARVPYRTLPEALAKSLLVVTEVSMQKDVHTIRVMNQGDSMVLLPAGERLPVAGHAWTLKLSLMVGPQATMKLPAEWIEAGSSAEPGEGSPLHGAALRSLLPPEVPGAFLAQGGRVRMVLFDRKETLRKYWAWVIRGATLPGATAEGSGAAEGSPLREEDAAAWLLRASGARVEVLPSPGIGQSLAIRGDDLKGGCLIVENEPVHLWLEGPAVAQGPALRAGREVPGASRPESGVEGNRYLPGQ